MVALYQKAEALYHLGDFEHSLVFYHRGLHVRPELEQFRLGVQKAREAIENAIGKFKKIMNIFIKSYKLFIKDRDQVDTLSSEYYSCLVLVQT